MKLIKTPLIPLACALIAGSVHAQIVISDDFNITSGTSASSGFGFDGVNTEIASRLTGQAASEQTLTYIQTLVAKADTAFSITDNKVRIDPAANVGVFGLSADGFSGFDFGPYLRGKVYEIKVTIDNDSVDVSNRRCTFGIGTTPAQDVTALPLGIQLQANANQADSQLYKRVDAAADPSGADVNVPIGPVLPYGEPVDLRIVVTDVDSTLVQQSSYEIFINGGAAPIDSGIFGIQSEARHLLFDIAPNSGPVTYDDFSVTVTGDAPAATIGNRQIYFVGFGGEIYGFTGVAVGDIPVTSKTNFTGGYLEATHTDYGYFQGFTSDPTTGIVYGIDYDGSVVTWPTVADWLANTNAVIPATGDPGYQTYGFDTMQGSVHGISYDPATGGFYVTYEGDVTIDGDIGEYANAMDFVTNTNAMVSASSYGGNLLNFYYYGEDAPGNRVAPNDTPGSNYFQAAGSGQLEGFLTLSDYITNSNSRTYQKAGFCTNCIAAFALPFPDTSKIDLRITDVTRAPSGDVTGVTLDWTVAGGASYTIASSQDLATPLSPISGFEAVTTTPVTVPVPAGFESRGFFSVKRNP